MILRDGKPDSAHVPLDDGWSTWRWVCLRSSGFPAGQVLALVAAPDVLEAIDRMVDAAAVYRRERASALKVIEERLSLVDGAQRHALIAVLKRVRAGDAAPSVELAPEVRALLDAQAAARRELDERRRDAVERFAVESRVMSARYRSIAAQPRFREALTWQNRGAVATALDALARQPEGADDSKTRQKEMLVASYLQRYCVKNDTIGFFGPVGWAEWATAGPAITVHPGETLLDRRTVYFEHWAVGELAARLSEDAEVLPSIAPRRRPTLRLEGTTLVAPIERPVELPRRLARLLERCDGQRAARDIARELVADPAMELEDETEVYQLLEELAAQNAIRWTLEVPPRGDRPAAVLRALLERVDAQAARERALATLDRLEADRAAVEAAAGSASALDAALERLDRDFVEATGAAPVRNRGQSYAGRTLVYEDCRRAVDVALGPAMRQRLAPSLTLVLQSARWYTHSIATRYRAELTRMYRELARETGRSTVDYQRFWSRAEALFSGDPQKPPSLVSEVVDELQARWLRLLALPSGERRVERRVEDLRSGVREAFAAPAPGWPSARFHSPDILVAARSLDAIARGDFRFVLGEVHTGRNTILTPMFARQHRSPDELVAAMQADLVAPAIAPVTPRARAHRADSYSLSSRDFEVELGDTRSGCDRAQVLAVGELVVQERAGQLVVATRDGRHAFDAIAFYEQQLVFESRTNFHLLPRLPHTPRVEIDGLVVARETWRVDVETLSFPAELHVLDRFAEARRWARELGLPRSIFARLPEEPKPVYVDFDSPIYVEIFARLCRKASALTVSEMLPSVDETWLTDAAGATYSSELRLVAVDPEPWRATPTSESNRS